MKGKNIEINKQHGNLESLNSIISNKIMGLMNFEVGLWEKRKSLRGTSCLLIQCILEDMAEGRFCF